MILLRNGRFVPVLPGLGFHSGGCIQLSTCALFTISVLSGDDEAL